MARRRRFVNVVFGVVIGLFVSFLLNKNVEVRECERKPGANYFSRNLNSNVKGDRIANEGLLFVGVMTAAQYLDDRAKAVYNTWGANVPGKILFFSSENSISYDLPLVALPGIDDDYPPQKKSFHMLKYMYDNFIDDFEWFLRADDDCFVRMDRLEKLLRSVDSRKPWFIGQTGKGNSNEFGLLSLDENENFCMGGPGIILSRETLKRMAPHIDKCVKNLYTNHEDVELGRCVRKFAGIPCTWSYEMQVILYHNQSGDVAFTGNLKQKEVHRAITMHPIKQASHMYRLYDYVKGLQIKDMQFESINLHRDIVSSLENMGVNSSQLASFELVEDLPLFPEPLGSHEYLGDTEVLGVPVSLNRYKSKQLEDVLDWELMTTSLYSYKDLNPRKRIGSAFREGLSDVVQEVMDHINMYSKQRGRIIDFNEILYGYWRLDPLHGLDLILDLSLIYKKYRGHKMTVPVRRHAYLQRTFLPMQIKHIINEDTKVNKKLQQKPILKVIAKIEETIPLPNIISTKAKDGKFINFILPLSGRYNIFKRFIDVYENVCIKEKEHTTLMVVLYKTTDTLEDSKNSLDLILTMQRKYPTTSINYIVINEKFSRGKALQHGTNTFNNDELLFFIDVDIVFNQQSLYRIRQNTIEGKKVYFPIVFSLYNLKRQNILMQFSDISNIPLTNRNGFWRQFGFGIATLYKSDFMKLGGFDVSISGWGLEDVQFFDKTIKSSIEIVRSIDTGLIHIFHPIQCSNTLEESQKEMCLGTKANIFASLHDLQLFYKKYKYLFR